jgi:cytochrome c553
MLCRLALAAVMMCGLAAAPAAAEHLPNLGGDSLPAVPFFPGLGDYQRGAYFARKLECLKCHGPGGTGEQPGWPKLAGQHERYLLNALRNYRDGHRPHPFMERYTDRLTLQLMHDLALYYACQTERPGVDNTARCVR